MELDIKGVHDVFRHFRASFVKLGNQVRVNRQAGLGGGVIQIVEHPLEGSQWTALPSFADFAENAMLNGVPLGGSRRIMAHGDV